MNKRSMGSLVYNYDHPDTKAAPDDRRWAVIEGGGAFPDRVGPIFVTYDNLELDEHARFGLRVMTHHCNGVNVLHGGMLGTFLDTAFAQTVLSAMDVDWNVPTISLTTDFLSPAIEGEWLESRTCLTHNTRRMAFLTGVIFAEKRPVLRGQAIFKIRPNSD